MYKTRIGETSTGNRFILLDTFAEAAPWREYPCTYAEDETGKSYIRRAQIVLESLTPWVFPHEPNFMGLTTETGQHRLMREIGKHGKSQPGQIYEVSRFHTPKGILNAWWLQLKGDYESLELNLTGSGRTLPHPNINLYDICASGKSIVGGERADVAREDYAWDELREIVRSMYHFDMTESFIHHHFNI